MEALIFWVVCGVAGGMIYIKNNIKLTISNDAIISCYQTLRHKIDKIDKIERI